MTPKLAKVLALTGMVTAATVMAGCGSYVRDGKSPARLVINSMQAASGAEPNRMGSFLLSDVVTNVTTGGSCTVDNPCPSRFNDPGQVELRLQLRDIGSEANPTSPSALNAVTISQYHVKYVRADNHNVEGVDVPYAFDGAIAVTVPSDGSVTTGFQLVRNVAKREAPLSALAASSDTLITVIAEVTFYGRDQAGNDVSVTGKIEITFGNFGDPS